MIRVLAVSLITLWWGCGDKGQSITSSEKPSGGNDERVDVFKQGDLTSNTRNTSNNDSILDSIKVEDATIENISSNKCNDEAGTNEAVLVETIFKNLNEVMAPLQNVYANAESRFGGNIFDVIAPAPKAHRNANADANNTTQLDEMRNKNSDQVIEELAISSTIVEQQPDMNIVNGVVEDFTAMLRGALNGEVMQQAFENSNQGQAVLSIDAKPLEFSGMRNGDNCGHDCSLDNELLL